MRKRSMRFFFFFQAEDGIRDGTVTGVQTCALPICRAAERGPVPAGSDLVTALAEARRIAGSVPDPELPMLTMADLGILRDISLDGGQVTVSLTPTYSGCPALTEMSRDVVARLTAAGFA